MHWRMRTEKNSFRDTVWQSSKLQLIKKVENINKRTEAMTWLELPLLFIVNISHHVIFCFRERNMMKLSKAGQISKSRKKQYVSKVSAKCPESSTFTDKSAHLVTLVLTYWRSFRQYLRHSCISVLILTNCIPVLIQYWISFFKNTVSDQLET